MSQHWPYKQNDVPAQLSPGLRPEGSAGGPRYKPYNAYSAGTSPVMSPTNGSFGPGYPSATAGGSHHLASPTYAGPSRYENELVSPTHTNHSAYATGLVSPPIGGNNHNGWGSVSPIGSSNNGWGHVPSAPAGGGGGGYSKSWNGEGSGYMAELDAPVTGPAGEVVFEMSGESVPAMARSDDGKGVERKKKEEEQKEVQVPPVQANPWPFYLDLPVGSNAGSSNSGEQDNSKGDSQNNGTDKEKEEMAPPPPAVPWPYHGPGDAAAPSVTIQPAESQRRKSAGDGDKPSYPDEDDDAGMSVLDEYLSDMGIDDDNDLEIEDGEGLDRKDSMLKVRPLSLASRMRASSVGAVPAGGRTYMAYTPGSTTLPAGGGGGAAQGEERKSSSDTKDQQPQYPIGTAPHHFYIPQSLAPRRKPVPSASPTTPTFSSNPSSPPSQHPPSFSSNPLSPPKQPPPAPLSPPGPPSEGRSSSPGYVAYRPPSRSGGGSGPTSPVAHPPPPPAAHSGGGGGGFVAYNPDGPTSPAQAAPATFTAFGGSANGSVGEVGSPREEEMVGGRFATYRKPTVSSPSEEPAERFTGPPYRTGSQPTSPGFAGVVPERYASPPSMEQQPNRYASPPAVEGRLASPPLSGGFPNPSSRQESPAQPSPVSSLGAAQQPPRVSPNTTGGRFPSPHAPPSIPQNQPTQQYTHHSTPPPPHQVASPHESTGPALPPSPGIPNSPPPPYMPVDLPPRPGSAGIPPSYRSSPSPPPRVGSYGPLRPSVTGDGTGYNTMSSPQTRPHAQSQPGVAPSSRPQAPSQSQHHGRGEAAPPPLPPRRTTSPPLPPIPPQMPPRPTAAAAASASAAAAPQGFGRGVPSAMNFPPPPKASANTRPPIHAPRPGPTRPPPAPSTQRPQGHSSSFSSSQRPQQGPSSQRPGHIGGPHQRPPPQHSSHSAGSGWRPPMGNSPGGGGHPRPDGRGAGASSGDMFWSASAKKWLYKTERLVEQTLGDIMQPQVDQGRREQMPGGYPRGRGR